MSTMKKMLAGLMAAVAIVGVSMMSIAEEKAASKPINEKCPFSGKDVAAGSTVDVKVEFCCNNCKGKFDKEPAKYLDKVAKGEAGKCIMNGKEASKSSTLTVGFCCNDCKGKAEADPKAAVAKLAAKSATR